MADADTKTKQKPKLSTIRPEYWRQRWLVHADIRHTNGETTLRGEHLWGRHPSREIADEVANKWLDDARRMGSAVEQVTYLGPVFFPAEP